MGFSPVKERLLRPSSTSMNGSFVGQATSSLPLSNVTAPLLKAHLRASYRAAVCGFLVLRAVAGAFRATSSPVKGREFYSLPGNVATTDVRKITVVPEAGRGPRGVNLRGYRPLVVRC